MPIEEQFIQGIAGNQEDIANLKWSNVDHDDRIQRNSTGVDHLRHSNVDHDATISGISTDLRNHDQRLDTLEKPSFFQSYKKPIAIGSAIVLALAGTTTGLAMYLTHNEADDTQDIAYHAEETAEGAERTAEQALIDATQAEITAEAAKGVANDALLIAEGANINASEAKGIAENATLDADNATKIAGDAIDIANGANTNASNAKKSVNQLLNTSLWDQFSGNYKDLNMSYISFYNDLVPLITNLYLELDELALIESDVMNKSIPVLDTILLQDNNLNESLGQNLSAVKPYLNTPFVRTVLDDTIAMKVVLNNLDNLLDDYRNTDIEQEFDGEYKTLKTLTANFELQKDDIDSLNSTLAEIYDNALKRCDLAKEELINSTNALLENKQINRAKADNRTGEIDTDYDNQLKHIKSDYTTLKTAIETNLTKSLSIDATYSENDADNDAKDFKEDYKATRTLVNDITSYITTWQHGANVYDVSINWWTSLGEAQNLIDCDHNFTGNETFLIYTPNDGTANSVIEIFDADGNLVFGKGSDNLEFAAALQGAREYDATPDFLENYCRDSARTRAIQQLGKRAFARKDINQTEKYHAILDKTLNNNNQYASAISALENADFMGNVHVLGAAFANPTEKTISRAMTEIVNDAHHKGNWWRSGSTNSKIRLSQMTKYSVAIDALDDLAVKNDIESYSLPNKNLADLMIISNLNPNYALKPKASLFSKIKTACSGVKGVGDNNKPAPYCA